MRWGWVGAFLLRPVATPVSQDTYCTLGMACVATLSGDIAATASALAITVGKSLGRGDVCCLHIRGRDYEFRTCLSLITLPFAKGDRQHGFLWHSTKHD